MRDATTYRRVKNKKVLGITSFGASDDPPYGFTGWCRRVCKGYFYYMEESVHRATLVHTGSMSHQCFIAYGKNLPKHYLGWAVLVLHDDEGYTSSLDEYEPIAADSFEEALAAGQALARMCMVQS
jgi:hypothetical protein